MEVIKLIKTDANEEYIVVSSDRPFDDIKEAIKADRLGIMRDSDTDQYYLFDLDGVIMCRQMNAGMNQLAVEGQLLAGPVVEIDGQLMRGWIDVSEI